MGNAIVIVTHCWRVDDDHVVRFKVNTVSQDFLLLLNERKLMVGDAAEYLNGASLEFNFGGRTAKLLISPHERAYCAQLRVDGEVVLEDRDLPAEHGPRINVRIAGHAIETDAAGGERTVKYEVVSVIQQASEASGIEGEGDAEAAADSALTLRSWAEFGELDSDLRSALVGTPSLRQMPSLPWGRPRWLVDHFAPSFVEQRRLQLEEYLQALSRVPRVSRNLDFLAFLGRSPDLPVPCRGLGMELRTLARGVEKVTGTDCV